jgi:PPP family 3-phenylpropionic acid transporter
MPVDRSRQAAIRRLAGYYLFLFAYLGVYLPWLPPLLQSRGFSPALIGTALGVVQLVRSVLSPALGWGADRLPTKNLLLASSSIVAGLVLFTLSGPWSPTAILLLLALHGVFLAPLFPLAEMLTLGTLGRESPRYGRIRLWGSIGFLVTSLGLAVGGGKQGVDPDLVPFALGAPLVLGGLLVIRARTPAADVGPAPRADAQRMPWLALAGVYVAAGLGQGSHGPYYAFFTIQMQELGVSDLTIGALWAWGVLAEVGLMWASRWIVPSLGLERGFRLALALGAVRWALYAFEPPLVLLVFGQTLHAASFALLHVTSVQWVDRLTPPSRKVLGQSLLSASVYGAGVGGGMFAAGELVGPLGHAGLYAVAAAAAIVGVAVSLPAGRRRAPRKP